MAARIIRRVEVLVNESVAGVLDIETDALSPRERVAFTSQAGCRITAQLGSMRISEEIDALESLGLKSVPFVVTTRLIAGAIRAGGRRRAEHRRIHRGSPAGDELVARPLSRAPGRPSRTRWTTR